MATLHVNIGRSKYQFSSHQCSKGILDLSTFLHRFTVQSRLHIAKKPLCAFSSLQGSHKQIVSLASCHSTPDANVLGRCVCACVCVSEMYFGELQIGWLVSTEVPLPLGGFHLLIEWEVVASEAKETTRTPAHTNTQLKLQRERECDRNSYGVLWLNTIDLCRPAVLARAASEHVFYC